MPSLLLHTALTLTLLAPPAPAVDSTASTWKIDVTHSELVFRIRHLVSRVNGTFTSWGGTITADPASWNTGSAAIEIQAASIDTRQEKRDTHLRSDDFFDATNYPTITFTSTSVDVKGTALTLEGDLTIRGVTRPVVLTGEYLGMTGAPGKERIGFTASTKINRLDYGVKYNRAVEGGGVLLGDEVEIEITVAAVRQP